MKKTPKIIPPLDHDEWIYRIVVLFLGLIVLMIIIGAIFLSLRNSSIPELMTAIGSATAGALAGLLSRPPR